MILEIIGVVIILFLWAISCTLGRIEDKFWATFMQHSSDSSEDIEE